MHEPSHNLKHFVIFFKESEVNGLLDAGYWTSEYDDIIWKVQAIYYEYQFPDLVRKYIDSSYLIVLVLDNKYWTK